MTTKPSRTVLVAHAGLQVFFWIAIVGGLAAIATRFGGGLDGDDGVFIAATAIEISFVALSLHFLRRIVGSVRQGDPFIATNVLRLRWMAGLAFAEPVVRFVVSAIRSETADSSVRIDFALPSLLMGFVLLVLAEVFAHGVRLREDVEATV